MSYTNKDIDNGIAYSNNRYWLKMINVLYDRYPHLTSHLEYSITQADPDVDYYYPPTFKSKAIKVTTRIPKKLCEKLSCNSVTKDRACTKMDPASYYIVGDTDNFKLQCQPSCYNLLNDPVIDDESGEEQVQMVRLHYNDPHGCVITPASNIWHEHPFYRSETVYEERLNDLPAGFNQAKEDPYSYSGITYEYNKPYCDAFFDQWDGSKRTCVKKWWEIVAYAVVGESIIKLAKAGIQEAQNGYKSSYPPVNFPPIPDIQDIWTVEGWKNDIDNSFIVPPPDYEITTTAIFREKSDNIEPIVVSDVMKHISFLKKVKNSQRQLSNTLRRKLEESYDLKVLNTHELNEITKIKTFNKTYPSLYFEHKESGDTQSAGEIIQNIIGSLLESVFTPAFWVDIGLGVSMDVILKQMKILFRKLANDIIPKLTAKLLTYTGKVFSKVFAKSVYATIANATAKIVVKTVSKIMLQLAKLMAEVASIVGIILAIMSVFDILLTIWDPLGFNNKFDESIIASVTRSSEIAMKRDLEIAVPLMTFDIFINMSLSTELILDESLNSFFHIYEYLDALTVNSEGSRIDKGSEISVDINGDNVDQSISDSKLITPKEIFDYENDHSERMKYFNTSMKVITPLLIIGVLFMVLEIWFVVILVVILLILIMMSSYVNITTVNIGKLLKNSKLMNNVL
nr:PIF-0 [Menippe mercenaria nudivirus]